MSDPRRLPFGSWPSPLAIESLVEGVVKVREPSLDGADVYWLEGRPENAGRQTLVRLCAGAETPEDLTPPETNVRDRVHEYGGGAYLVDRGVAWYSDFADGRLHRRDPDGSVRPISPSGPFRYADLVLDRTRDRLICVREDHTTDTPATVVNELVALPAEGGDPVVLVAGSDFYANPRVSPDGRRLAWLSWEHPNLPWDETSLWIGTFDGSGAIADPVRVAGEPGESVVQPRWSPGGVLHFVAERSGWWNLHRFVEGESGGRVEPVAAMAAELAHPQWVFRLSSWTFVGERRVVAAARSGGRDSIVVIDTESGAVDQPGLPFTEVEYVEAAGERVVFVGASPHRPPAVVHYQVEGDWEALTSPSGPPIDRTLISAGRPVEFPTTGERTAHGIFYPPHLPGVAGLPGELPPLIVMSHGGPTASAYTGQSLGVQLLTTRGYAVLDVDYGGSAGYGRAYRKRLEGTWGVVDVDDCEAGARWLAEQHLVDPERLAIEGGSASGYTTLAALAFRDTFRAGICHFGIGDLETFVTTTHKFESRYIDSLIGPYPERADLYRERSPLRHLEGFSAPALITQGMEDKVVPVEQGRQIVDALRATGLPVASIFFPGEDHGYRQAPNIIRAFEAQLSFLGQVFGFTPADPIEPIVVENLRRR